MTERESIVGVSEAEVRIKPLAGSGVSAATEGRKYDGDKLRFDMIPVRPLLAVVNVFTIGAKKYGDRNWEQGIAFGRIFAAMMRHAWSWWGGERNDQEDGQHHLASVAWCAMALIQLEETHPELDDRAKV